MVVFGTNSTSNVSPNLLMDIFIHSFVSFFFPKSSIVALVDSTRERSVKPIVNPLPYLRLVIIIFASLD